MSEHWPGSSKPVSDDVFEGSIAPHAVSWLMAKSITLHPSIIPRLDPEYATFHNEHIVHLPQVHELPWDPSIRKAEVVPGSSEPLPVGKVEDFDLSRCRVRVFTPEKSRPETGWPVLVFFHGGNAVPQSRELFSCFGPAGGWTLGNIDTENAFCTKMCKSKGRRHHSISWTKPTCQMPNVLLYR